MPLDVVHGPVEQGEMVGVGPPGEGGVELGDVGQAVAAGGRDEADPRPTPPAARPGEVEDLVVEERVVGLHAEPAAAHRDDDPLGRRSWRDDPEADVVVLVGRRVLVVPVGRPRDEQVAPPPAALLDLDRAASLGRSGRSPGWSRSTPGRASRRPIPSHCRTCRARRPSSRLSGSSRPGPGRCCRRRWPSPRRTSRPTDRPATPGRGRRTPTPPRSGGGRHARSRRPRPRTR